jgi:tetratricopeptide (TPR) repeat protein
MSTTLAHTVVDLNNSALSHFLKGDYERAIGMLRIAFEAFTANLTPYEPIERLRDEDESPANDVNLSQEQHRRSQHESLPSMMVSEVDSLLFKEKGVVRCLQVEATCSFASSPGTAYSMYNRALVLSRDQVEYDLLVQQQHRTSAIILYNLALVHHNIGVHLGVSAALPHALRLYEMAQETIDQRASNVNTDVQKLILALLNNRGNIHTHLFHFENANRCLNSLRVVLAASSSSMAMDDDYIFFFLNALFQGKELCFAPAA